MNDDVAIKVENVSKTFKLPHEKNNSIKGAIVNFYKRNKTFEKQEALQNITFEVKKGEFFGIVGRNGSGKSTLLKMLAGIYTPSAGTITVKGKLTPFIELGVGFSPELTGRENVFLNGALLGFSRKEMETLYDDIVEFAEIERFMDQKLKNYSSGMQVRLAFSIAIRAKSDVLLIDEVLAVGDAAFQRKCYEHFLQLKKEKCTVVLVTHDMGAVERFCDSVIVIHEGLFRGQFAPRDAAVLYEKMNLSTESSSQKTEEEKKENRWGTGKVKINRLSLLHNGKDLESNISIPQADDIELYIELSNQEQQQRKVVIGLAFYDQFGVNISGPNSVGMGFTANDTVSFKVKHLSFNPGQYYLTAAIFDEDVVEEFDHIEKALVINVTAASHQLNGKVNLFGEWNKKNG
jgi:ABC-2 type transport system ATP-binding protein